MGCLLCAAETGELGRELVRRTGGALLGLVTVGAARGDADAEVAAGRELGRQRLQVHAGYDLHRVRRSERDDGFVAAAGRDLALDDVRRRTSSSARSRP